MILPLPRNDHWVRFGADPSYASETSLKALWHMHAKRLHPDNGGNPILFNAMKRDYERCIADIHRRKPCA
jgi:hypothetical protein